MNIYESLASAIVVDHGAVTFNGQSWSRAGNIGNKLGAPFWHWLLVAYGEDLCNLPVRYKIPLPTTKTTHEYPELRSKVMLGLGLDADAVCWSKMSVGFTDSAYTVLGIATALLRYGGPELRPTACKLLDPALLLKVYPEHSTQEFVRTPTEINPYKPSDFGLAPLPLTAFLDERKVRMVDSIGNAAWFDEKYLQHCLQHSNPAHLFGPLRDLQSHDREAWAAYAQQNAVRFLTTIRDVKDYKRVAEYLHLAGPTEARRWLHRQNGASKVLWSSLADAAPAEMAQGLATAAVSTSGVMVEQYKRVGRKLTIEDFRELSPLQALRVLYHVPFECVEDVIKEHNTELGSMFFAQTKHLDMVTDCMTPHGKRGAWDPAWKRVSCRANQKSVAASWEEWAKPMVAEHLSAKAWRERLLAACEPSVAFLAQALHFGERAKMLLPLVAIETVLHSYPNIDTVMEIVKEAPPEVRLLTIGGW